MNLLAPLGGAAAAVLELGTERLNISMSHDGGSYPTRLSDGYVSGRGVAEGERVPGEEGEEDDATPDDGGRQVPGEAGCGA